MKHFILIILSIFSTAVYAQKKTAELDRSKPPIPGPAPTIKLADIPSFQLANGMKVFVVENHKLPIVSYSIQLDIDPEIEGETAGTANITGELLSSGTKNRSKDKLDNDVDFIGAKLQTFAKGVYASSLKKQQNKLIELMADVVINSEFKQEELDKIKTQTISGLAAEKDDPDAIYKNVKSVLNYTKAHPYGEIATEESVGKITLENCNKYYKTYFRPNVAYMAIVGDVTLSEIKPLIEKYFSAWQKAEISKSMFSTPMPPQKTKVAIVNKPGAVQSVVSITYPIDLKPNSDDVIKAKVLNTLLGGGASSRLFINLREKHGYTYGSYSSLTSDELVGEFSAYAKVRNVVSDSSVDQLLYELNRLKTEKVPQEELDGIKSFMNGKFAISLEDPATIAEFAINIERYNLPKDYYSTYLKKLAAVTVDDVFAMAQKYIRPENATILLVGDKSELAGKMQRFSGADPISFFDNYGNKIKESTTKVPVDVTPKTILESYIKAIGGKKAISEVKDVTTKMNAKFQGMDLKITTQQKAPNKYAMSINMGNMLIQKDVFDGIKGKQSSDQGKAELTGESLEQIKGQATLFVEMHYEKMGYKLNLAGVENINGKDAYKLEVTSPKGLKTTRYYDVETGLRVRELESTNTEKGPIVQITDILEYKEVSGVKFPSSITISGAMAMKLTAESINTNLGVEDTEFNVN